MLVAIFYKYWVVPYYFTEMNYISKHGGTLFQPLYFQFPNDPMAYKDVQNNIMLGPGLKASILTDSMAAGNYDFYFSK